MMVFFDPLGTLRGLVTYGLPFLVLIGVLILVHEWGHFIVARLTRMPVEEFWIGFPPPLKTWQRGDLKIGLGTVPLGGFVKITGMNLEDWDHPEGFNRRPLWARILVLLAGCAMNVVAGFVILALLLSTGEPHESATIQEVRGRPARTAKLQPGDTILAINGKHVANYRDVNRLVGASGGKPLQLRLARGRRTLTVRVTPELMQLPNPRTGAPERRHGIGLAFQSGWRFGRLQPVRGVREAALMSGAMLRQLALLPFDLLRRPQATLERVGGPLSIAQEAGRSARQGIASYVFTMAQLSFSLALFNLFPIPALDGGRILLILYGYVHRFLFRRQFDPRIEIVLNTAGLAFLLLFMLVISAKDLGHLLGGG